MITQILFPSISLSNRLTIILITTNAIDKAITRTKTHIGILFFVIVSVIVSPGVVIVSPGTSFVIVFV